MYGRDFEDPDGHQWEPMWMDPEFVEKGAHPEHAQLISDINDGSRRVVTREGKDVTRAFETGARAAAAQGRGENVRVAILKAGSPSCGSSFIYDGTFSKTPVRGEGITAALLRENGIVVFSEDELDAAEEYVTSLESSPL